MNYWMVKQEPEAYSYDDFVKEGKTDWTGVRNYQARNNLKAMKEVVGTAKVTKENFPDPTDEKWFAVELTPDKKLKKPVSLAAMKANLALVNMGLLRQSQLSVIQLTKDEYDEIISMSK